MESYSSEAEVSIKRLVKEMKKKLFSAQFQSSLVSPSAFDTAWLAMIPDSKNTENPMFKCCVDWLLNNQQQGGFWGDDHHLIHTLTSTLTCILALVTWNVGPQNIELGKSYVARNAKKLVDANHRKFPRWFTIVFPPLLEEAERVGLHIDLPVELKALVSSFNLNREKVDDKNEVIMLSCAEAVLSACDIDDEIVVGKNLNEGGSLFQSPSATAAAYMATGHPALLKFLDSVVLDFPCGVPSVYPVDEELINLCMLDKLLNLGLADHFAQEIQDTLAQIYRSYNMNSARDQHDIHVSVEKIYKDALAFRLLRFHGFDVTPEIFCWFLDYKMIMDRLEDNTDYFASTLYNIYRASDLTFPGEYQLEDAKSFSRRLLEKIVSVEPADRDTDYVSQSFRKMVKKELSIPWIARIDHLDHRMWIENIDALPLCLEKPSFSRLSCLDDDILIQLSLQNYKFRQSIFKNELEELKSWSKQWGLADMGFGREKTTYCYFAVCGTMYSPHHSVIRKLVTKSASLITVADDFYDMEGSLTELQTLTEAVQRWDGEGLIGPSKIIFNALDYFVRDMVEQFLDHERHDMTNKVQALWKETFLSWMTETTWGRTGYRPSADEYLDVGMTSIAAHTLSLPSSCFLNQRMPARKIIHPYYETITKLLMVNARLLNDIQSYQKEQEEGKNNIVLLYLKENPNADIEDSIEYVKKILNENRMEFLKKVLGDDYSDMPKPCKSLHLACLKVFEMFFNSSNLFDSKTALLEDIEKAIYIPPRFPLSKGTIKPDIKCALINVQKKKGFSPVITNMNVPSSRNARKFQTINWYGCTNKNMIAQKLSRTILSRGCRVVHIAPQLTLGFL